MASSITADEARKELARRELARRRSSGHREFDGANVPGYNPETGMVDKPHGGRTGALLSGAVEGLPIVGPTAQKGVENAAAGIGSLMTGEPFSRVRSEMGGMVDRAQEAHPGFATAGNVGGAVLGTLPLVMAAPAAFGAGGGGLLARSLAGGASGAALGGGDAAVRSGGDMDAIKQGIGWGAGLGAAGPAAGQAVGAGTRAIAQRFGGRGGSLAEQAFGRAVGADGIDDIGPRLSKLGPDAMPMDLGPNLQRQAGALAASPGRNQEMVRSTIANRQSGAGGRISATLDDALGQPVDTIAVADDIIAKRSAAAKPLYDAAYAKPVTFTPEMQSLLKRPSARKALQKAQRLAADEGIPAKPWFVIGEKGDVSFKAVPGVRELDLTKRALDDMIDVAKRAGNKNEARILTQTKDILVGMVDKSVPEYAAARKAFSGPASVLEALEEGRGAFKNSITPQQLRRTMAGMGEAEKEAFTQGARASVADIMGTARNDALAARSTFQKGFNKEKLAMIVGDEQAAKMLQSLDAESAFTRTRDVVTGNSETAARISAQADIGAGAKQPGVFRNALNMRFGDAAADLGDKVVGGMRSASQSKVNDELARLLTSKDPAMVNRTIQLIQAAKKRGDLSAQKAKELIQGVTIGGGQQRRPLEITVP